MKKVLLLPFLQIPSGHHQVADAVGTVLKQLNPSLQVIKIDILSYTIGKMESLVSKTYLKWIQYFPTIYSFIYQTSVCKSIDQKRYFAYEGLFGPPMKRLLNEINPDLIICTHSLPSYLLGRLKQAGKLDVPVMNIYTDFFIHNMWGTDTIDYHFISHPDMEKYLAKFGVTNDRIFLTGIPVHPDIKRAKLNQKAGRPFQVLISGGSLGVGEVNRLLDRIQYTDKVQYYILCGKNQKLFQHLIEKRQPNLHPLSYIVDRQEMNGLYDRANAIITKPGGVTVSECLVKRLPIFIYHALPGQEEINQKMLGQLNLIHPFDSWRNNDINEMVSAILEDGESKNGLLTKMDEYHHAFFSNHYGKILKQILNESSQARL